MKQNKSIPKFEISEQGDIFLDTTPTDTDSKNPEAPHIKKKIDHKNTKQKNKSCPVKKIGKLGANRKSKQSRIRKERELAETLFGLDASQNAERILESNEFEIYKPSNAFKRKAAWIDEEDASIKIKDVAQSYSKAKGTRGIRETSEKEYKELLEEKFTEVYGETPEWSKLDRVVSDQDSDDDDSQKKTGRYLSKLKLSSLPKTTLDFKFVSDLNKDSTYKEGNIIHSIDFKSEPRIALVAGGSLDKYGTVSLFQVDGKKNLKLKSIVFPKYPINCARFFVNRNKLILSSSIARRFYTYDIEKGETKSVPFNYDSERRCMKYFELSPDGKYIASVSKGGVVRFLDVVSLGMFEMVSIPAEITALAFDRQSDLLYIHSDKGRVFMYSMSTWESIHSFYDQGCISGTSIAVAPNGRLLACGSSSGIMNLYETSILKESDNPTPVKVFKQLVTPITLLAFNEESEILAMASVHKDNACRLIHVQSMTVFSNFPGPVKLQRVNSVKFSPDSKLLAIGNNKKTAKLCRLLHY